MDWSSIVIFVVIVFALFWLIMRLRGTVRNPNKLQVAMDLISSLNEDLKIIRGKQAAPGDLRKFRITNWKVYQLHLEFLEKDDIENIKSAFAPMVEYNAKLAELKVNPDGPKPQIDLDNLKTMIVKARAGLARWIQENVHREATKGMFSWRS